MSLRLLRMVLVFVCLAGTAGGSAWAQGRSPGGSPGGPPPGSGMGPGGPGAGGGPGGPGGGNAAPAKAEAAGLGSASHGGGLQFGPVGRWWDDKSVVQTIGLRSDQQKKMDAIFIANKPAILSSYKTFLGQQAKLDALSKDPHADKTKIFAAIDAVSQARAALQKATTQMLLEIRQQMDSAQIAKLEQLH